MIVRSAALVLCVLAASPALAHTGAGTTHGFGAGLLHPMLGLDHVMAMGAVGLWAGLAGGRALWTWPAAFVVAMALAALVGMAGLALPGIETGIALSVLALGALVTARLPVTSTTGAALCAAFAVAHGYAHGAEMPAGADALPYGLGFVLATAGLHAAGIGIGRGLVAANGPWPPRFAGVGVAAAGLAFLIG